MRTHLASLVEDFRRHGNAVALVTRRGVRRSAASYTEVATLAGRFAAELERRGIIPGDRVVLWGANSAEWVGAFFGCLLRGVIAVPLDAAGPADFAERVLADVKPKLVVGDIDRLSTLPGVKNKTAFDGFAAELPFRPLFTVAEAVDEDTPFQIVFTSGTTSDPKGVVHTHMNVLASLRPIEAEVAKYRRYERWVHPLRFLHTLPFSHVFGQFMGLWIPAVLAAEVHLETRLEPARLIETVRKERISVLVAVPRVLEILRAHLLRVDPALAAAMRSAEGKPVWTRWWLLRGVHRTFGWKFWALVCGGATLPEDLEAFWNVLGFALIQGYGMTETAALVTLNHPFKIGKGTIGKALPGREVKLENGEILVRGEMLATAMWQGGAMQQRASEWLATGDLAKQDARGELRFLGRKGDVIVTAAGMNIHPADLERAIKAQAGVRGCVVVPCDTAQGSEPVAAVLWEGSIEGLASAVKAANGSLAEFQQVRRFVRWPMPNFPYTSSGKLLRREVAAWTCAQLLGEQEGVRPQPLDPLVAVLGEVTREAPVRTDDEARLTEDFRLDSLGRVQLAAALQEHFSVDLEEDAVAAVKTLGDLRLLLARDGGAAFALKGHIKEPVGTPRDFLGENAAEYGSPGEVSDSSPSRDTERQTYPRWPWTSPVLLARCAFLEGLMRPLVALLAAPEVTLDVEVPDGPLLIVANHVTTYDVPLLLYALPGKVRRRVAVAMAGELLVNLRHGRGQKNRLLNLLAPAGYWLITALFNVFPLPRLRSFRRSFAHAGKAMDNGYSVLVFPEGTRSWGEEIAPFRQGVGMLAKETGATVLPVALHGQGALLQERARRYRSGKLRVHVGAPIHWNRSQDAAAVTAELEATVRAL